MSQSPADFPGDGDCMLEDAQTSGVQHRCSWLMNLSQYQPIRPPTLDLVLAVLTSAASNDIFAVRLAPEDKQTLRRLVAVMALLAHRLLGAI
jgi:hypothetical protein